MLKNISFLLVLFFNLSGEAQSFHNMLFNSNETPTCLKFNADSTFIVGDAGSTVTSNNEAVGITYAEDRQGNLLFVASYQGIFNKNNELIPGSDTIKLTMPLSYSVSEIVTCQNPSNENQYYIFYTTKEASVNSIGHPLYYTLLDLSLRSNKGALLVTSHLIEGGDISDGLEIIPIPCSLNFWLLAHECSKGYKLYKINEIGIGDGKIIDAVTYSNTYRGEGELDFQNGKICHAPYLDNFFYIADFDAVTGTISNGKKISLPFNTAYGIAFSPKGSKIYITKRVISLLK